MPDNRLTVQQERDLVIAAERGDADARRRLVAVFLPAIAGLARSYPSADGVGRQELLQEGVAGLLFAAQRYDPARNTPFWAYASFWVRKAMQDLVAELTRPVALSDRAVRALAQIKRARNDYVQAHGAEPTNAELSRATGLSNEQLEHLLAAERSRSFQQPLGTADGDAAAATLADTIADAEAERAYEQVLDGIQIAEVRTVADRLDARERAVLEAHYGLGRPAQTLAEIGVELGLTAERVRQIEAGALEKLRETLTPSVPSADGAGLKSTAPRLTGPGGPTTTKRRVDTR
jgi:RNA polymerase primary sigma factor